MKLPQLTLRELFAIVTSAAISFALIAATPTDFTLQLTKGLQVALVLIFAAVIAGGGWRRSFAIGFLVTLLLYFYFPEQGNGQSYFTEVLLQCFPKPSFYGTPLYDRWMLIVDNVLGINVSIAGGFVAREVRKVTEHRGQS